MTDEKKMLMIQAGNLAFSYKKQKPSAEIEEIMGHVIRNMHTKKDFKIFGIAAASLVLKQLEKKPGATEKEVMQNLINQTPEILGNIDLEFKGA